MLLNITISSYKKWYSSIALPKHSRSRASFHFNQLCFKNLHGTLTELKNESTNNKEFKILNNIIVKQTIIYTIIILVISTLFSYIIYKSFTLLSLINSLFTVGINIFLLSVLFHITKNGFFDGITYSFRNFYKSFSKKGQLISDDIDHMALPSEYSYSFIKPMFYSSLMTLSIMLCLLYFYN